MKDEYDDVISKFQYPKFRDGGSIGSAGSMTPVHENNEKLMEILTKNWNFEGHLHA